jgi:hypothetical protein
MDPQEQDAQVGQLEQLIRGDQTSHPPQAADKVFRFVKSGATQPAPSQLAEGGRAEKRDWSSAIDLVNEACEAVRISEERAAAAERYTQELSQHYTAQVRALETRMAAAERRADAAEANAADAERWLVRFHDAIVTGFKGVLNP